MSKRTKQPRPTKPARKTVPRGRAPSKVRPGAAGSRARPSIAPATKPQSAPITAARPKPPPQAEPIAPVREASGMFPVVGIGASAGGIEALEQFFRHLPDRTGMAFVVVQHLDPTHKGMMVELLQRASALPVEQIEDRTKVLPDHVYVIPPSKDLTIMRGVLHLLETVAPRGLNLPIDLFFRSLADDQQERSIGVVLSGMGSDGTLGLRAIKEKAGVGFVQSLTSAKFDSMPRSAIDAGLADVVAPVEELPDRIVAYVRHAPYISRRGTPGPEDGAPGGLEKVLVLLRAHTGNDFSLYKRSTIYRRIERRMGLHQIDRIANYVRLLREEPKEIDLLFKELLIGVTSFFRDPIAWEHLRNQALPELLGKRAGGSVLRAWVPGCSTGEEAYSLAIVFKEALERLSPQKNFSLQVFATDLDRDAIEKARAGVYPANIAADVSLERLNRFFVKDERGFRVGKEIREMVIFAPQNIVMDPPFTKLDILSCRNLLIYLAPELQKKLIPLFHYSLNAGGVLFLGSAETIGGFTDLFVPLDGKSRTYGRIEPMVSRVPVEFPALSAPGPAPPTAPSHGELFATSKLPGNLQALADRVLAQRFSPAAVLTTDKGDILYISGRTGKFLEPAAGKANWNVLAMAREGLRFELSRGFGRALRQDRPVVLHGVKVGTNGETQRVDVTLQKLVDPDPLRDTVMVVFNERAPTPAPRGRAQPRGDGRTSNVAHLERELQQAREEVQTVREEMQTSQEELKSTNEELQSTNEELQSTNEELTTSKEEMQSLNEELSTVNHELQAKLDDLSRANNDMKNLLNSTDIATLFLDGELRVRRYTTLTAQLIKLIPGDAGRPVTDIATELEYPRLIEDARDVLRTLVFKETTVASKGGRWYAVRIMPYRTLENVIDGVVITFTDATVTKTLENALREQASELRQMTESLPTMAWGCAADGSCHYFSRRWLEYTGVPEAMQIGFGWLHQVHPDDRERVSDAWRDALASGQPLDADLRIRRRDGEYRRFKSRAVPIRDGRGEIVKWYGTHTDVDDVKRGAETRGKVAEEHDSAPEGLTAR